MDVVAALSGRKLILATVHEYARRQDGAAANDPKTSDEAPAYNLHLHQSSSHLLSVLFQPLKQIHRIHVDCKGGSALREMTSTTSTLAKQAMKGM